MTVARFPVLLWQSAPGSQTACLIGREGSVAAVGKSAQDAVRQLRDYVAWSDRQDRPIQSPDLSETVLYRIRVQVRPEYSIGERVVPCEEELPLDLAVVEGKRGDLVVVHVPRLDLSFYRYPGQALRELVSHFAQQKLRGSSPRELARALPPGELTLTELAVTLRARRRPLPDPRGLLLRQVAEPLGENSLRKLLGRAWGREAEVADLASRLRQEQVNLLLVGEAGVGKTTALVEAVRQAERARREEQGLSREDAYQHWLTSGAQLISGMPYLGQWEARLEQVIEALANRDGVLCFGNLLEALLAGGFGPRDGIASFLIPYLEENDLRLVAEVTPGELSACQRHLPELLELFQIVRLESLPSAKALEVLHHVAEGQARQTKVACERAVVETIERLFRRFAPYQPFPGRAAAFLRQRFLDAERARLPELGVASAVEAFVQHTGVPARFLKDSEPLTFAEAAGWFRERVIGQEAACAAAAELALTFKAGLNDPQRPLGVLLFCGPTGVGKTALARALADSFFGGATRDRDGERLIRLDMSEYSGPLATERLLGTPDGSPGELVEKIRRQPFSVVLLDEIEKADPRVFDVLMGVFDEGRLTDRYGRWTTFRSAVLVLTSNLGATSGSALGFGDEAPETYRDEVERFFRPELFNRIDRVVSFGPLSQEVVRRIAAKELRELEQREGLQRHGLRLAWSEAVIDLLVAEGFDPRYGARPLQRAIEEHLVAPLARRLVDHGVPREGGLRVEVSEGHISIEPWQPED